MIEEAVIAQESKDMFCLMMYDQSAAFDLVDHDIFLQKLKILGFEKQTRHMWNRFEGIGWNFKKAFIIFG